MKFLLNMNVPRVLAERLRAVGHECRHVGDLGLATATDTAVVEEARRNGEVILTHDLDYGNLLAFSGTASPSVVILRLRNTHPANILERILKAWPEIATPLERGAIVVLEDVAIRIRQLLIVGEGSD